MEHPEIQGLSDWQPLARGGLAVVWQVWHQRLDRLVAVKVYQPEFDDGYGRCFAQEAAASSRLSGHRGIVSVHGVGTLPDGRPYLVMELCPGGSLTRWLQPQHRPDEERVRRIGVQLADALAAVHSCGVVHGDIKPANILIDRFGNPRLADFGLAAIAGSPDPPPVVLRTTPAYAPPEAFWTEQPTAAGDVFSLGATLYALLAGSPPRGVRPAPVTLEQMLEFAFTPIGRIPGVRWDVMGVLMNALSNDPAARPTAATFGQDLAKVPVPLSTRQLQVGAAVPASSGLPRKAPAIAMRSAISTRAGVTVRTVAVRSVRTPGEVAPFQSRQQGTRRTSVLALAAAALVTTVASTAAWLISVPGTPTADSGGLSSTAVTARPRVPEPPVPSPPTAGGDRTESRSADQATIRLAGTADSAKPWETVAIRGTYVGRGETLLRVQHWDAGEWREFPIPTTTDESGSFIAYVELGQPSRYRLRVLDPDAGAKSKPFVLDVRA